MVICTYLCWALKTEFHTTFFIAFYCIAVPGLQFVNYDALVTRTVDSLTTRKQTTKVSSANFQIKATSKVYHIENSKTRWQIVYI